MTHCCVETNMDGCLFCSIAVIFFFIKEKKLWVESPREATVVGMGRRGRAGSYWSPAEASKTKFKLEPYKGWCLHLPKPFPSSWGSPATWISAPEPLGSLQMERIVQDHKASERPLPLPGYFSSYTSLWENVTVAWAPCRSVCKRQKEHSEPFRNEGREVRPCKVSQLQKLLAKGLYNMNHLFSSFSIFSF